MTFGYYNGMRILDAEFVKSVVRFEAGRGPAFPEVCFVGRSNVGKSSMLNTVVNRKIAKTSSTPGATRLINLYRVRLEWKGAERQALFSDFPGFGYSKVSKATYQSWQTMVETYVSTNPHIRRVIWLLDVRRDMDELDRMLLEWLDHLETPFTLVLTKADKEGPGYLSSKKSTYANLVGGERVFGFSARTGYGKRELLAHLAESLAP